VETVSGVVTTYTVTGLVPGADYYVAIVASNIHGWGTQSDSLAFKAA